MLFLCVGAVVVVAAAAAMVAVALAIRFVHKGNEDDGGLLLTTNIITGVATVWLMCVYLSEVTVPSCRPSCLGSAAT